MKYEEFEKLSKKEAFAIFSCQEARVKKLSNLNGTKSGMIRHLQKRLKKVRTYIDNILEQPYSYTGGYGHKKRTKSKIVLKD